MSLPVTCNTRKNFGIKESDTIMTKHKGLPTKREIIDYLNDLDTPLNADSDIIQRKMLRLSIDYDDSTHEITGFVGDDRDEDENVSDDSTFHFRISILGCPFSWTGTMGSDQAGERKYDYPELSDGDPILDDDGKPVDMTAELENALNIWVDIGTPFDPNAPASLEQIERALLDASTPDEDNFFIYNFGEDRGPVFYYEVSGEAPRKLMPIDVERAANILFAQELPVEIIY